MKKALLTSVAMLFAVTATTFAAIPTEVEKQGFSVQSDTSMLEARRKARVRGGSGCDDPGDAAEHPAECDPVASLTTDDDKQGFSSQSDTLIMEARRKARVRGGSGCDDPGDAAEHPAECGPV